MLKTSLHKLTFSLGFTSQFSFALTNKQSGFNSIKPRKVFFDHDGGLDDYLALMLLTTMPNIDLIGCNIIGGNCILDYGVDCHLRVAKLTGIGDIPLALS